MSNVVNFYDMRAMLKRIAAAMGEGYLIGCSWDGSKLRASIGRRADQPGWRKPWVMTFDDEADYLADPDTLIAAFVRSAKTWFEE